MAFPSIDEENQLQSFQKTAMIPVTAQKVNFEIYVNRSERFVIMQS